MALSTVSTETLEWRKMIINKIWTSCWDIHIREMLIFITFVKLNFSTYLSYSVFENMNLLSHTQPKKRISVFTSERAVIVDIITMCIGTLVTRT